MSGATCATCRFFGGGNQCRLKPPAWISDGTLFQPGWFFPRVDPGDWCGEHAPTPAVGVPAKAAELPDGWRWDLDALPDHTRAHSVTYDIAVLIDCDGDIHADGAPIAVVEAVIARHRTRAGGAA